MAKESGKNVIVKVGDGGGTEVFTALSGQVDATLTISASSQDASDKTTNNWGSTLSGTLSANLQVSGYPNWPDTAGWDRLRSQAIAGNTVNLRLVANAAGGYFSGTFSITSFALKGPKDAPTGYDITFQNYGALTWAASGG